MRRPYCASHPSIGWVELVSSLNSRYRDLEFEGMEVICPTSVVLMFRGMMCSGVLPCGEDLRGTMKCQTVGRPAESAVQSTDSFSQSTFPRRNVGPSGLVDSEDRMGTDSCGVRQLHPYNGQSSSSSFSVHSNVHSTSRLPVHIVQSRSCSHQ